MQDLEARLDFTSAVKKYSVLIYMAHLAVLLPAHFNQPPSHERHTLCLINYEHILR